MARRAKWPVVRLQDAALLHRRIISAWSVSNLWGAVDEQQSRWFPWLPVFLIIGIAMYYALPREPDNTVFVIAALTAAVAWWISRTSRVPACLLVVALVLSGFVLGKIRTERMAAPALAATTGSVKISGWVAGVQMAGRSKGKVILDVDYISRIRRDAWPRRVQMTLYKLDTAPRVGEHLQISGRLFPLMTPVLPGGYDHGRTLWFRGIGASGRGVLTNGNERLRSLPARSSWQTVISGLRVSIGNRIYQVLPRDLAAFAEALITGNRASIKKQQREQLSIAGLAHVLAISGLHMSLVAGGMFWTVRALLALFPMLVLAWPIKKIAAVAALVAGGGYLVLSGGAISTQRAYVMLLVMSVAVLFDRPAISMRNLAIAAIFILLVSPDAIMSAGFQMSFMAVMGLIATYEALRERRAVRKTKYTGLPSPAMRLLRWAVLLLAATATTTIIASIFTTLPAAYHFNRVAPLGLIANLLALPVVMLVVMPMAMLATLLMPLGLEAVPLGLMGQGLHIVLAVAEWVASLPLADNAVTTLPGSSALCLGFASIWLCLWTGRLRLLGIVPALAGIVLATGIERPDILIERTGKNVAVRNADGSLVLAQARRAKYAARKWLLRDGDDATPGQSASREGWSCNRAICQADIEGRKILYLKEGAVLAAECGSADIVISDYPLRGACPNVPVRIDRFDLWRHGAHAIYLDADVPRIVTMASLRGDRPWVIKPIARRKIQLVPTEYTARVPKKPVVSLNTSATARQAGLAHRSGRARKSGSRN